jgi:hypothetical protein
MANGVHPSVEPMQAADRGAPANRLASETRGEQLVKPDHAVLTRRDLRCQGIRCGGLCMHHGYKPPRRIFSPGPAVKICA